MKASKVKKADTFLVSRIPSWKLFSRLENLCIKRAILGKMPLKALQAFRRRLGNQLPRLDKRRVPMNMSQPITENSNPNLARAPQRLIPFQTVNSLPSRNWIKARFSRPSKAPAKILIQTNTFPTKRITEEIPGTPPYLCMQAKIEGDGVVQSVITTVFSGGISTYFSTFLKYLFQWYQLF